MSSTTTPRPATTPGPERVARVPMQHRRTAFVRLLEAWCRYRYGAVLEPALVALHNRRVLVTLLRTETSAARWNALDPTLKALATLGAAASIGCSWCLDFGYWQSRHEGVPAEKLTAVPRWRDAGPDVLDERERAVLAFAEALTATPPTVDDAMVAGLRRWLDDAALVELTAVVALENQRSRCNAAMGLTAQGFQDQCDLPGRR
jgi:AhpD family alkylhydroperoxidase